MKLDRVNLVVITGAGSGIGRATALAFAEHGAKVIASDIDELAARETAELIVEGGGRADAYQLDVTQPAAWKRFAKSVRAEHGVLDVLVNNAGILIAGTFLEHSAADWDRQLDVNLTSVAHGCRTFAPQMIERGDGGHIVNIASAGAFLPSTMAPAYCVSKAGVRMLSECLRMELSAHDIGVTAICPSVINTDLLRAATLVSDTTGEDAAKVERAHVLAPLVASDPRHVANAVVRSVRHNWAIIPVRPEAWLLYGISRLSPGLVRTGSRHVRLDRLIHAADTLLPDRLVSLLGGESPTPQRTPA